MNETDDPYDLAVVGGGLSGLTTATAFALHRPGSRVALLEKQPRCGGYVTSYRRGDHTFDTAQMMPDVSDVLQHLGVDVDLVPFEGYYMRIFLVDPADGSSREIRIPSGHRAFRARLCERYPYQADEVSRFLDQSRALYEQLTQLKLEPSIWDAMGMLFTAPQVVRHANKTFEHYIRAFGITDPEIHEILNVFVEFSALPASQVSAMVPISAMHSLLDGAYRPAGEFADLPRGLQQRFEALGGEVRTSARVERIAVQDGTVRGVELKGGEALRAARVVTTVDPKQALQLVGRKVMEAADPEYVRRLDRTRMSWSSFNVNLGLDGLLDLSPLRGGYNVLTTGSASFAELFEACERGENGYAPQRFHIGVICPSLVTGALPYLTIRVLPLPMGDWGRLRREDKSLYRAEKERFADFLIDLVDRHLLPDLARHVVVRDLASPATYARYSGSPTGSVYDMAPTPANFGRTRLPMRTPIRGLVQPKFVHGILGALYGGLQAADMMLEGAVMGGRGMLPRRTLAR